MVGSEIYQFKLPKKVQNQKTSLPTLARFKKPIPIYFLKKSEMSAPRPQFRHLLLAGNAYFVGGSWIALRRHYYWQSLISEVREDHYYSPTPMKHYPFFSYTFFTRALSAAGFLFIAAIMYGRAARSLQMKSRSWRGIQYWDRGSFRRAQHSKRLSNAFSHSQPHTHTQSSTSSPINHDDFLSALLPEISWLATSF